MAKMTNCKTCGKEIAKGAKSCPNCGKDQRSFFRKHKILTVIGVLIILGIIGSMGSGEDTKQDSADSSKTTTTTEASKEVKSAKEPTVITTDDLIDALDENALKASKTYKDQYVEVKGKLSNIDSSGDYFTIDSLSDEFSMDTIMCYISEEHLDAVMNFEKEQEVTVIGNITDVGEVMGYSIDVESIK